MSSVLSAVTSEKQSLEGAKRPVRRKLTVCFPSTILCTSLIAILRSSRGRSNVGVRFDRRDVDTPIDWIDQ